MKGLLLKDFYATIKQGKLFLSTVLVIFIILSSSSIYSALSISYDVYELSFYLSLMSGVLPLTLISLDEKGRWCTYSKILPVTNAQYVTAKYIIGLMSNAVVLILSAIIQAVKMTLLSSYVFDDYILWCAVFVAISFISSALILPLALRFGVQKGYIMFYLILGVLIFVGIIFALNSEFSFTLNSIAASVIIMLITIALYAVSWRVSIKIYNKREF